MEVKTQTTVSTAVTLKMDEDERSLLANYFRHRVDCDMGSDDLYQLIHLIYLAISKTQTEPEMRTGRVNVPPGVGRSGWTKLEKTLGEDYK